MSVVFDEQGFRKKIAGGCVFASMAVAMQIKTDTQNLIPKREGSLRKHISIEEDGQDARITWSEVYAHRQYTNQYTHYTEPGTGPWWVEKAAQKRGERWRKLAQNALAREMNK